MAIGENGFGVELRQAEDGTPVVVIVDVTGRVVSQRSCHDGTEARTYASTVRQHIYWLSADKFREYYKI
jgi:hypothetical protein